MRKKPTKNPEMDPMLGQGQVGFLSTIWILQNRTTLPHPGEAPENPSKTEVLQSRNAFAGGGFSRGSSKSSHVADSDLFFDGSRSSSRVCKLGWFAGLLVSVLFFLSEMPGVVRFPGNNILGKLSGKLRLK